MPWVAKQKDFKKIPDFNLNQRIADKKPQEPEWETLHNTADENEQRMIDLVIRTTEQTKEETNKSQMRGAYLRGDESAFRDAIPLEDTYTITLQDENTLIIRDTFNKAARAMILHLPASFRGFTYDEDGPRGIEWVRNRGAELVTNITSETRRAIQNEIHKAFIEGLGADTTADNLINLIGLTERHSAAVTKYRKELLEEGASIAFAKEKSEEYASRLLRWRAENIARTELMTAANAGHHEMLRQAAEQGVINPNLTRREWIVTPDDRLCPLCRPMAGVRVKIDELFPTSNGLLERPPLHPQCRCITGTVFI